MTTYTLTEEQLRFVANRIAHAVKEGKAQTGLTLLKEAQQAIADSKTTTIYNVTRDQHRVIAEALEVHTCYYSGEWQLLHPYLPKTDFDGNPIEVDENILEVEAPFDDPKEANTWYTINQGLHSRISHVLENNSSYQGTTEVYLDDHSEPIVLKALDLYRRIHLGQLEALLQHGLIVNYAGEETVYEAKIMMGYPINGSRGICNKRTPERAKIAHDLWNFIKTKDPDPILKLSRQPLPTIG